ncbi:MAG TPA: hypothetical protein VFK69_02525, partial [Candidatus Eisenbacteria bacterium]|nr:hypothetical protein [Candidatus Eisenbacteria bacterium]
MRRNLFIAALLGCLVIGGATAAFAQMIPEVRPFAGAFVPTGKQRDVLKDTWMIGAQGGVEMAQRLHAIATLAWAANPGGNDPSVFDYNAGIEAFQPIDMSMNWQVRPFAGLGLGARTYVGHGDNTGSETQFAGYGALGTEFQIRRIALRIEGRDYLSRFKGLNGTDRARTGNDLTFSGGVAFHW